RIVGGDRGDLHLLRTSLTSSFRTHRTSVRVATDTRPKPGQPGDKYQGSSFGSAATVVGDVVCCRRLGQPARRERMIIVPGSRAPRTGPQPPQTWVLPGLHSGSITSTIVNPLATRSRT